MSATLALTVVVRTVSGLFSTLPIAVRWRSVSRLPAIAGDRKDTTAAGALADAVAVVVGSVPVSTALALPSIAIDTSGYDTGCRHSLHDFTMPRGTRHAAPGHGRHGKIRHAGNFGLSCDVRVGDVPGALILR
ncbi:hypothetical protein ACQUFY_18465 [Robbsia andropogonis]|uniref:hypothetical protein n=1 Tax=Robbsia andropogonis TaxID=28092 RepID=UPI003D1F9EC6